MRLGHTIFGDAFGFLSGVTTGDQVPKLTIPSPDMVHYRGGRAAIDESVYPDLEPFWADLTAAYAEQVRRLGELGCTYLQLDDTSLAYLHDPEQRAMVAAQGGDPEHLYEQYVANVNAAIAGLTGWASFLNQGQICMTTGRYFVADRIYDEFVERLAAKADHLPVGNPATEQVVLGPVIDERSPDRMHGLVDRAGRRPARLSRLHRRGLRPGRSDHAGRLHREAVRLAAQGDYGLSLGIVTRDVMRGLALAEQIPTGRGR